MMDMEDYPDVKSDEFELLRDHQYTSDKIKVTLIAEKKGTFLKHTEYEITSEKHNSKVERRYNDFALLYHQLLEKYSFRIIPRLPPKQLMLDAFLEERRCGLQRWLYLMSHHPIIANDEMFKVFLTDTSGEQQTILEEAFSKDSDEFEHLSPNKMLPRIEMEQLITHRDLMRLLLNRVVKIKRLMEQQAKRELNQSADFEEMSAALDSIMRDTNDNSLHDFSEGFLEFSKHSEKVSRSQQRAVMERLIMVTEVISAYLDMCDRIEKVLNCNNQTSVKMSNINSLIINTVIRNNSDEERTTAERNQSEIESLRMRRAFSLQCMKEETKLAQNYLKLLPSILLQFSNEEAKGFTKFAEIFNKIVQVESDKLN